MDAKQIFEILVRENSRMLTAYIRSTLFDSSAIDDVWQETMLVAWRRLDDFDMSRPFGPWLRGIAQKIILSKFANVHKVSVVTDSESLEYLSERFDSLQRLAGDTLDEKLDALRNCVGLLPEHERACIELRYKQDLKPAELSERMNVALETVKKRLVRAKQHLIDCIDRKLGGNVSPEGAS